MIITIIFTVIFLVCLIVAIATDGKYRYDDLNFVSTGGSVCFGVALIISVACIIGNYITMEIKYDNTLYEKQVLEYRLETKNENSIGNELLYNDIVEFNNELRRVKKYANSPWTSWFNNPKIAAIDYIEILEMTYAKLEPIKEK